LRGHFVSAFQRASHGAQNFGVGQTHGAALPPDTPSTVALHLSALSHDAFGHAFLNAARPSLAICAMVVVIAALFASGLRGGRSAAGARRGASARLGDVA
jgi:hypothetical protein